MQEDSQGGKSKAKPEHKSKSAYCDVITKPYFLIVVAKYASHYSVVPIHTRKSDFPKEYVELRDRDQEYSTLKTCLKAHPSSCKSCANSKTL